MSDVVALGECMVEMSLHDGGSASVAYAGDTFNTAVYLSRLGLTVAYATALGLDDPFSEAILGLMSREGLDASLVARVERRLPGLYAITRDAAGERRFFYWRGEAPVRDLFDLADRDAIRSAMSAAKLVYLTGVSLAVVGERGREVLDELLAKARTAGAVLAFDPNYRPSLWTGPANARAAIELIVSGCRYVSASAADVKDLYDQAPEAVAADWASRGVEVVLRHEDRALTIFADGAVQRIAPATAVRNVDTTGAGDAFNAGYLAGRLKGRTPNEAAVSARRLARVVVQHIGAIIARAAMPEL